MTPTDDTLEHPWANDSWSQTIQDNPLHEQLIKLQKDYADLQEICKKAQNDYIMLKLDFDQYQNRMEIAKQDQKIHTLIDVVKKFLPFIDGLEKSLATVKDAEDNPLVKGVQMTYDNFLGVLAGLKIFPIDTTTSLDSLLHEPVGTMPVDDETKKWQIISCVQTWFVYRNDQTTKVVQTAKVIVGA